MSYSECFSVTVLKIYCFNPKLRLFLSEIGYYCSLMKMRTAAHSSVDPHTVNAPFFVFPCKINRLFKSYEYQLTKVSSRILKGRYTRGVLLPEHLSGARSGNKAPPCVPMISWVYCILGSRISTPQNAPRYLTG